MAEQHHGSTTIKEWMEDFASCCRDGQIVETSAGAEPAREYAYLHFSTPEGRHSILVLRSVMVGGQPEIRAFRFDGAPESIRERIYEVTHAPDPGIPPGASF